MQNRNCPSERDFLGLLSGDMTEAAAEAALQHLDECANCEETFRNLEAMDDTQFELDLKGADDPQIEKEYAEAIVRLKSKAPKGVGSSQPATEKTTVGEQRQIGSYRLEKELGRGGMGVVYKATHTHLDKTVAIKLMPAHIADNEALRLRFEQEMKAVGRLDHPNIVRALDAGHADGQSFLSMEYVAGRDIASLLKGAGTLKIADACEIVRQAAVGMQYAHSRGLVHRDLKPANLMLTSAADTTAGVVKVLDLGLALIDDRDDELTPTGQIMGTLDYVAPEQVINTSAVDIRADIYSLGATLYKLLTGHSPLPLWDTDSPIQKLAAIQEEEPVPIGELRAEIPQSLAELVHSMLAKSPDDRPDTPAEVAESLADFTQDVDLEQLIESQTGPAAAPPSPVSPRRKPRGSAAKRGRAKRLWIALGFAVTILLAIVLVIQTDRGTVTIQTAPELAKDLRVTVLRDGKPVVDGWHVRHDQQSHSVRSGRIEVVLPVEQRDEFVVRNLGNQLTLRRGEEIVFSIERKPDEPAAKNEANTTQQAAAGTPYRWSADLPKDGWQPRLSTLTPERVEGDLSNCVTLGDDYVDIDPGDKQVLISFPLPANRETRIGVRFAVRAELEVLTPARSRAWVTVQGNASNHWFQSVFGTPYDGGVGWMLSNGATIPGDTDSIGRTQRIEPTNPKRVTLETVFLGDELQTRLDGHHFLFSRGFPINVPVTGVFAVNRWHVRVRRFDVRVLSPEEASKLKKLPVAPEYRPLDFKPGPSLEFDGIDDYVKGPVVNEAVGPHTVESWIAIPTLVAKQGEFQTVFSWDNRARTILTEWGLKAYVSHIRGFSTGTGSFYRSGIHHLAQCWDGKVARSYIDGRCVAENSEYSEESIKDDPSDPNLLLGVSDMSNGTLWRWFKGSIYSFRISRRALYKRDFYPPAKFTKEKETILLYMFDESVGNVLHDSSGNGYHAEIHGATWGRSKTSKDDK